MAERNIFSGRLIPEDQGKRKVYLNRKNLNRYVYILLFLILISTSFSCGVENASSGGKGGETGGYVARLVFPPEMLRHGNGSSAKGAVGGIDCEGNEIHTINCTLYSADDVEIQSADWLCSDGYGIVEDIPPGTGIRVEVTASDASGAVILEGEDYDIIIEAGRQTVGRDIEMVMVDIESPPEISIDQSSPINLDDDQTSTLITGTITAEANLKEVRIRVSAGSILISDDSYETFDSEPIIYDDQQQYEIYLNIDNIDSDTRVILYAVDDLDQQSDEIEIIIHPADSTPLTTFRITLGAQENPDFDACASLTHQRVYLQSEWAQNCSDIDIIYINYRVPRACTLFAPDSTVLHDSSIGASQIRDAGWATYNATWLDHTNLSSSAFDTIDYVDQLPDFPDSESDRAEALEVGDVLAFRTASGHRGIIRITRLIHYTAGEIEFIVKVEP